MTNELVFQPWPWSSPNQSHYTMGTDVAQQDLSNYFNAAYVNMFPPSRPGATEYKSETQVLIEEVRALTKTLNALLYGPAQETKTVVLP